MSPGRCFCRKRSPSSKSSGTGWKLPLRGWADERLRVPGWEDAGQSSAFRKGQRAFAGIGSAIQAAKSGVGVLPSGRKTKLLHHPEYTISDVKSPYPPAHDFDIIENKQLPIAQLRNNHLVICAMSDCRSSRWILSAGMPQKIGGADGLKPVIKPLVSSKKTANRFDPLFFY